MPCHSSPRPESRSCSRDAIKYADEGGVENIKDVFHASNRGPQIPTLAWVLKIFLACVSRIVSSTTGRPCSAEGRRHERRRSLLKT